HALVGARTRTLERDRHARVTLDRHVPNLDVPEERHPGRPPALDRGGEDVDVHERAPVLAGAPRTELAVGVPQADGCLPGVDTRAEHLELELGEEIAHRRWRVRLDAEARLPDAVKAVAGRRKLAGEGRQ